MKKTIKVGVIGLGVGEAHIKSYKKIKNVEVVSICDLDNSRLKCSVSFVVGHRADAQWYSVSLGVSCAAGYVGCLGGSDPSLAGQGLYPPLGIISSSPVLFAYLTHPYLIIGLLQLGSVGGL